jgi:hypothetical protein
MLSLLLVERKKKGKKRKKKWPEGFLPRVGHTLLALPCGIFAAVRCN